MARKQRTKSKAFNDGLAMRKKVLGADYVEKSFKNADEFSSPFQELATEFAWGTVWTRPDLSLRDRSLITLAQCIGSTARMKSKCICAALCAMV